MMALCLKSHTNGAPMNWCEPIWNAGDLQHHQFFRVAAWKSASGLGLLTLNSEAEIVERTENAVSAIRPWRRIDLQMMTLTGKHGISR